MTKATHRKISNESWAGAAAMAAHGGVLYIVHNETLYEVSPSANEYRKVSDEAWSTRLMASDGVHLYTIEGDGGLYRIRVEDGSYERINGDDWSSTVAIAVVDGKLWTADTSGVFYAVDLGSGTWQQEKT